MDDIVFLMHRVNSFKKMAYKILIHRFAVDSKILRVLPKLTFFWILHLQVQIDFVLECLVKSYCMGAILIKV